MFPNLFIELKRSKSTQQQLAERIGISHSSLQNKLQGRTQFTLKEMRDIQAIFFQSTAASAVYHSFLFLPSCC